ncbi:hypothetical protein ACGC1H_000296 [Rhizoctonia solani]
MGVSHSFRFKRLGELSDLENAIEYLSRALTLTPDRHPHLPGILVNLGLFHGDRFERLGKLSDLENAIKYQSRALALTPKGHPHLPRTLANLAVSHEIRFERLGELSDLDNAIEYEYRAVALTPDGHPDLPSRLANLGGSHSHRFERLGELSDLKNAIEYKSRALALTPNGHPDLPSRLTNLGASHHRRFERLGELSDLDNAIEYLSCALALTPDGHPHLPSTLTNLGASHCRRFARIGEVSDLENGIEYESRAVALTPDGHPDLPSRLTNLGGSHIRRFEQRGEVSDLENAIDYQSRALALTPDNHPDAASRQYSLAWTHLRCYRQTIDHSYLQHSLSLFRSASQSLSGAPRDKFMFAQVWTKAALVFSPDSCIDAYQTAIDLLPQYIWLGATTTQRYQDLSDTEALAVDAASAAIRSSNHSLALEWLEHARCVVWNQSLMLRSPLDHLHSINPDLGTQLQNVADQLHNAGSHSRESQTLVSGSMTPEQVAQEHRRLAKRYDDLLVRIRELPGFNDFLRPMKAKGLVQAARTGPVVVINCHQDHCDALLVLPHQHHIHHVPLPNFSGKKAQSARSELEGSIGTRRSRERGVVRKPFIEEDQDNDFGNLLGTLWYNVVKPVLDYLGYTSNPPEDPLPHITWCPTGPLSFLPLHAAGDYDQPRSRVFDYVISSYTPTLTALLNSIPSSFTSDSQVLAVGQEHTPGHNPLPGTMDELARLKAHIHHKAKYTELVDDHATTSVVLNAMEQHDWVHIACHAHQNVDDATQSGFFLHDGVLDLASINRRSLKNKGLAFLSACQTAKGDKTLADEAVHLASGMLMAGYTSVIATMWSVNDSDGPLVTNEVYYELVKGGQLGNGEAGRALHKAVALLRKEVGEQSFERWVPYIHIGS